MNIVDHLVCSEKFAKQLHGDTEAALSKLAEISPNLVITLGEKVLIWQQGTIRGALPAFPVKAIDTTSAGDAFHGAYAAAVAQGMEWDEALRYASVEGALCCTKAGAGLGGCRVIRSIGNCLSMPYRLVEFAESRVL